MNKEQWEKIINYQVSLILIEKGIIHMVGQKEVLNYKYEVALQLLCELGK